MGRSYLAAAELTMMRLAKLALLAFAAVAGSCSLLLPSTGSADGDADSDTGSDADSGSDA